MKVYDLADADGRVFAFEVDNWLLGRHGAFRVARSIPGVRILRAPRFLSFLDEDQFCEFELDRQRFDIWEPWGGDSRYWIGPEPPDWCEQLDEVRAAFVRHQAR